MRKFGYQINTLVLGTFCLGVACSTHHTPHPHINGTIKGNSYTSPAGHFSVPYPVSPEVGGKILRDDSQSVTFYDNLGNRVSFYAKPFNDRSPMQAVYQQNGAKPALETLVRDIYGKDLVTHFHPDTLQGTLTFTYIHPNGIEEGVGAFVQNNRVYLVESDLPPGMTWLSKNDDASRKIRDEQLESHAIDLLQTISVK